MNSKLTVVATISAAVGAAVSWAITADYYERRTKDAEELSEGWEKLLRKAEDDLYILENNPPQVILNQTVLNAPSAQDVYDETKKLLTSADKIAAKAAEHSDEEVEGETDTSDPNVVDLSSDDAAIHEDPGTALSDAVEIINVIDEVEGESVIPPGETEAETRSNLQSLIDEYTHREDAEVFAETAMDAPNQNDAAPFVITKESFAWDEDEGDDYSKISLTYYPAARLLLDEEDEPIEDPARTVGWRNLQRFGDESGDADTVFIRNRKMRTDFEVVRELEEKPPLHVQFGMGKEEFATRKAAGLIRLRDED